MDPDPAIFVVDLQDANNKRIKKIFFAYYLLEGAFLSFLKIKIQIEVTKQQESRFFLLFLLGDRRIRIQEAQKHVDPVYPELYPDPQHCRHGTKKEANNRNSVPNPSAEE
jgi:hypothetical protein